MALTKIGDNAIVASTVTQHVTATDLQPVKSDISALALREATNESSAAFNLPNQFIDTFTDDTNLGTQTDCDRTDGYIATVSTSNNDTTGVTIDSSNYSTYFADARVDYRTNNTDYNFYQSGRDGSDTWSDIFGSSGDFNGDDGKSPYNTYKVHVFDLGSGKSFLPTSFSYYATGGEGGFGNGALGGFNTRPSSGTLGEPSDKAVYHSFSNQTNNTTKGGSISGHSVYQRYFYLKYSHSSNNYSNLRAFNLQGTYREITEAANATGTLIQSANAVGSAKTKVGGTMLYKDNSGTATLGTDLKIYFTCNGGTNWTEASSYSAITPVYSTGIKQVRLGETTCTSGTDIRYKAVWANQASGSKETQLHGIGVNY